VRPRLLDLFCGAGGAAMGYHRAGFDVVGVDVAPQPNYPFEFVQADITAWFAIDPGFIRGLDVTRDFNAIHASPPCQAYTTMNNRHGSVSPPLITETREWLEQTGLPYVIENVPGAKRWMRDAFTVNGAMVGIRAMRPRLFETNWSLMLPPAGPTPKETIAVYGKNDGRRLWTRTDGSELRVASLEKAREAMGIGWMEWDEIREAIPPAYTQLIGEQLLNHLRAIGSDPRTEEAA
jgi:DNA (cytosine-5)-methyltransferase 1